jgi:hypothetical protein
VATEHDLTSSTDASRSRYAADIDLYEAVSYVVGSSSLVRGVWAVLRFVLGGGGN